MEASTVIYTTVDCSVVLDHMTKAKSEILESSVLHTFEKLPSLRLETPFLSAAGNIPLFDLVLFLLEVLQFFQALHLLLL